MDLEHFTIDDARFLGPKYVSLFQEVLDFRNSNAASVLAEPLKYIDLKPHMLFGEKCAFDGVTDRLASLCRDPKAQQALAATVSSLCSEISARAILRAAADVKKSLALAEDNAFPACLRTIEADALLRDASAPRLAGLTA